MREDVLMMDIARTFSERYPKKRGQLFHVSNERNNPTQAFRARAIGIVPGVADFIFFSKKFDVATEIKVPGSRHQKAKVRQQARWGELWEKKGKIWRLCTTVEQAIACYNGDFQGYTVEEVYDLLSWTNTKTIKF